MHAQINRNVSHYCMCPYAQNIDKHGNYYGKKHFIFIVNIGACK